MPQRHSTPQECKFAFQQQMNEAASKSGRWLAAMFYIDDKGEMHLVRTTSDFPLMRAGECVGLLEADLRNETHVDTTPLPAAPGFPRVAAEAPVTTSQVMGEAAPAAAPAPVGG